MLKRNVANRLGSRILYEKDFRISVKNKTESFISDCCVVIHAGDKAEYFHDCKSIKLIFFKHKVQLENDRQINCPKRRDIPNL